MKKIFTLMIVAATFAFAGCAQQSELNPDTLPLKCVISGHAYYSFVNQSGSMQNDVVVPYGTEVRILYAIPDNSGKINGYAVKSVVADVLGGFRVDIGCPAGKSLKVKCETSFESTNYVKPEGSYGYVPSAAIFFGSTSEKSVAAGSSLYFEINAGVSSNLTYPGTN